MSVSQLIKETSDTPKLLVSGTPDISNKKIVMGFLMRYYGFLANRKRRILLPEVYAALDMKVKAKPPKPGFASLMK